MARNSPATPAQSSRGAGRPGPLFRGAREARWLAGDIFAEHVTLPLPKDIQPGRYDLVAGMYSYPDIIRLPVASDRPYAQDGLVWLQHVDLP